MRSKFREMKIAKVKYTQSLRHLIFANGTPGYMPIAVGEYQIRLS